MFNLLPEQEKKELARDWRLRFAAAGLILFAALGAVALFALVPSFFLLRGQADAARKSYASMKAEIVSISKNKAAETLVFAGKEVAALTASSSAPYDYELVSDVIRSKTEPIQITGVKITRNDSGPRDITVIGQAADRDSLLAFVQVLQKQSDFKEVAVPVSNFADALNLKFSILIKTR